MTSRESHVTNLNRLGKSRDMIWDIVGHSFLVPKHCMVRLAIVKIMEIKNRYSKLKNS
jgi:hypothetical protein